mgnify:CR=1 FL=1
MPEESSMEHHPVKPPLKVIKPINPHPQTIQSKLIEEPEFKVEDTIIGQYKKTYIIRVELLNKLKKIGKKLEF